MAKKKPQQLDLADILFRYARATPGEWETNATAFDEHYCAISSKGTEEGKAFKYYIAESGDWGGSIEGRDALYIVGTRKDIPAMAEEITRLRKLVADYETAASKRICFWSFADAPKAFRDFKSLYSGSDITPEFVVYIPKGMETTWWGNPEMKGVAGPDSLARRLDERVWFSRKRPCQGGWVVFTGIYEQET